MSHELIRLGMAKHFVGQTLRRFKSMMQAQRFLGVHAEVYNLFNLCRHLFSAGHYRLLRQGAFASWENATAA